MVVNGSIVLLAKYSEDSEQWFRTRKYVGIISGYLPLSLKIRDSYVILGNNYGLGETRKTELLGACETLGITRKDRCVVLDHKYFTPLSDQVHSITLRDVPVICEIV